MMTDKLTLPGKDNYGKLRQDFADKLAVADEQQAEVTGVNAA